jgi:hypothetical protein
MNVKAYLGDAVFAHFDGYEITLTTENGICATNEIVLEPEVIAEFERFIARIRADAKDLTAEVKT